MLTLHHLEYSQSFRILWLLEELGAPYDLKIYERDSQTNLAPADYKALSPLGTAPVVTDGDLVLAESNAIIDFVLDAYPESPLRPQTGHPDRARHLFWFHAAQGSLVSIQGVAMVLGLIESRSPWPVSALLRSIFNQVRKVFVGPRLKALYAQMEKDLGEKPYFGGDQLTAADVTLVYPLYAARDRGAFDSGFANIAAWFERVEARPAFQAARQKDGRDRITFRVTN